MADDSLTGDQIEELDGIEDEHLVECVNLRVQREEAVKDLKVLFIPATPHSAEKAFEISAAIACLRTTLIEESDLWSASLDKIIETLTPAQGAKLVAKPTIVPDGVRFLSVFTSYLDNKWKKTAEMLNFEI